MLFNSLFFILFFIWVLIFHYSPLSWQVKKRHLLLCSYLFYAAWNPPFIALLAISTLWDWKIAKKISAAEKNAVRKRWLWLSLGLNLGLLVVFKYSAFLLDNFSFLLSCLSIHWTFSDPGFILPMGISFYTFQTLSYTLDVYYHRMQPWHQFSDYALYVSFFPQLVAGPIVRAKTFLPQTLRQQTVSFSRFSLGISLLIIGLFEKTVLADSFFAPLVDQVFADSQQLDRLSAWLGALFFSGQIFCDFAGYSLCAIGIAMALGFQLPNNFQAPFAAIGFSDLWRRWHISLSSWLRDYVYIPLGGSHVSRFYTGRNLMLTMLLGGLWHGAAWTFVIWGGLHGIFLVIERGLKQLPYAPIFVRYTITRILLMAVTFYCVMSAFVVFRADSLQRAVDILTAMWFSSATVAILPWDAWTQWVTCCFVLLLLLQWVFRNTELTTYLSALSAIPRAVILFVALSFILISASHSDAFIYFQF